jgi:hypothetical protein
LTGSTAGSLSTSDVFKLSVTHGNNGVGNGSDDAQPGNSTNNNDAPGTGPGNPGSKGGPTGQAPVTGFDAGADLTVWHELTFSGATGDGQMAGGFGMAAPAAGGDALAQLVGLAQHGIGDLLMA